MATGLELGVKLMSGFSYHEVTETLIEYEQ